MRERCELWRRTKIMAEDKGFSLVEECPLDNYCDGNSCLMQEDITIADELKMRAQFPRMPIGKRRLVGKP